MPEPRTGFKISVCGGLDLWCERTNQTFHCLNISVLRNLARAQHSMYKGHEEIYRLSVIKHQPFGGLYKEMTPLWRQVS